ncbi:neuronal pentraxin-2b isoform X1 [Triplophysa rosa]|uniref:Neuronal pentraxin IIb n=1 Tax=Triplophysa rosa TaxID=992332 RepID=A0A9W7TI03_TRIRA|nr:neuronal pentraxin-2b isoform X1 [Triplophysa rosa]KAI7797264.1 neuronal pentraxin IIb precursor [Triplophysa rosa]
MLHFAAGVLCVYAFTCVKVVYGQDKKGERFLCTAIPIDVDKSCPVQPPPVQSATVQEEELRNTVMQLRETILQQKETIANQLGTIKELTSKLSRCESDSEYFRKSNKETMDDVPKHSNDTIDILGKTMQSLKDRLENLEQQQMRANISGASFPNDLRNLLQRRLEDLENQLLKKVNELKAEKSQLHNETVAHRQRTDNALNLLTNRISELENGEVGFKSPENFKISLPLRTNYHYGKVKRSLPEMYAFTICLWLKASLGTPGVGTPFSYGVPGQANEIVLIEWDSNPPELLINDKVARLPLSLGDGRWHHVCITWTVRDGVWEAYQDGQNLGSGENLAPWHPIKPGGVIILGQEQDIVGGRFDANQAFVGELSHFNIWDRVLRSTDIVSMANCSSYMPGNVVAWTESNIEVFGGASKWPLELCETRLFDG